MTESTRTPETAWDDWPADLPTECTRLSNDGRDDCIDRDDAERCPSCKEYGRRMGY